jgi:hypothetical protein
VERLSSIPGRVVATTDSPQRKITSLATTRLKSRDLFSLISCPTARIARTFCCGAAPKYMGCTHTPYNVAAISPAVTARIESKNLVRSRMVLHTSADLRLVSSNETPTGYACAVRVPASRTYHMDVRLRQGFALVRCRGNFLPQRLDALGQFRRCFYPASELNDPSRT